MPGAVRASAGINTTGDVAMFIDHRGGTGGGIFRYMYGRFLTEAAAVTGEPRLAGMGTELAAIGGLWEQVAAGFAAAAQAGNPADLLETATKPMHDIAGREQDFWERLAALIAA
jgi:hypothetical protein